MNLRNKIPQLLLLLPLILLTSCGRKQKNIFDFATVVPPKKVHQLELPAIKRIKLIVDESGNTISLEWRHDQTGHTIVNSDIHFLGYNVYRFAIDTFIPHHPINKHPIKEKRFTTTVKQQAHRYIVYPVYEYHHKIIEGPSSKIVGI